MRLGGSLAARETQEDPGNLCFIFQFYFSLFFFASSLVSFYTLETYGEDEGTYGRTGRTYSVRCMIILCRIVPRSQGKSRGCNKSPGFEERRFGSSSSVRVRITRQISCYFKSPRLLANGFVGTLVDTQTRVLMGCKIYSK